MANSIPSRELSYESRVAIYLELATRATEMKLPKGAIQETAEMFHTSLSTVSRIWRIGKNAETQEEVIASLRSKKKGRCGRNCANADNINSALKKAPLTHRRTLRSAANVAGVHSSTLWRVLQRGKIRRISNHIKPLLTSKNKIERTRFALSFVDSNTLRFNSLYDYVHIDEKWFYICTESSTFYIAKDEKEPHFQAKSKRYLPKVMFLCAVARPRFDSSGQCVFDGKLGIWPFVSTVEAKRASKNRPAGTPVLQPIRVNKEVYTQFLVEKVFKSIREKFPRSTKTVYVQHDNASAHSVYDAKTVINAGNSTTRYIKLLSQPPNSPDFNVLDLGFFRSIQSIQHTSFPTSLSGLIHATTSAFESYDPLKLNDIFLTLQKCFELAMKNNGGNDYKLPHLHKTALRNSGQDIPDVVCDEGCYNLARNVLKESS